MPRLYLDENFSQKLAQLLRSRGVDAISAHEVGTEGLTDPEQLAYAAAHDRVIVTSDHTDFTQLVREARPHAGVVVSYEQCRDDLLGVFADRLQRALSDYTDERLRGALVILDAFR